MSAITDLITEMQQQKDITQPILEGFQKLLQLELTEPTKAAVGLGKDRYQGRIDKLRTAINACKALVADGYSDLPEFTVTPDIAAELQDDKADISAALEHIETETEVTSGTITFEDQATP